MRAVFRRELFSYFSNITGYLFCGLLLFFAGIYTMILNLHATYAQFEYVLSNIGFAFLILTPVLTMRVIAEERRQKTDQLLYSLPLSLTQVVMGKYTALLAVLAIPTVILGIYPLILRTFGDVNLTAAYGTLIGFYFLGAALLAMGLFFSALTENPVVAAALCFVAVLLNYYMSALASVASQSASATLIVGVLLILLCAGLVLFMTRNALTSGAVMMVGVLLLLAAWLFSPESFEGVLPQLLMNLSLFERFYAFVDGVFNLTSLIYFLSVSAVCLTFCVQILEKRRWN